MDIQNWAWGFAGGLIIGLAGALFLLANGRILGASGIVGGLMERSGWSTWAERFAFLAGLILVPRLMMPLFGPIDTHTTSNVAIIVAGGALVGLGTRLANGCTSGHGVCGISRLSLRGIVATVFYILAGGLTLAIFRHVLGVI